MFCNLYKPFPLSPSFLFPEIRWQEQEKKQSEKKEGEVKKPNRTLAAHRSPSPSCRFLLCTAVHRSTPRRQCMDGTAESFLPRLLKLPSNPRGLDPLFPSLRRHSSARLARPCNHLLALASRCASASPDDPAPQDHLVRARPNPDRRRPRSGLTSTAHAPLCALGRCAAATYLWLLPPRASPPRPTPPRHPRPPELYTPSAAPVHLLHASAAGMKFCTISSRARCCIFDLKTPTTAAGSRPGRACPLLQAHLVFPTSTCMSSPGPDDPLQHLWLRLCMSPFPHARTSVRFALLHPRGRPRLRPALHRQQPRTPLLCS
jgi:hypothetical protein